MKLKNTIFFTISIVSFVSCIKDGEITCPVNANIEISIQDKNYRNVRDIERLSPVDENSPLVDFIHSLSLSSIEPVSHLRNTQSLILYPTEKIKTIPASLFREGTYEMVALGNYTSGDQSGETVLFPLNLHPEGSEGQDIYLGQDRFEVPLSEDKLIQLKRTKGKLLIQFVGFTADMATVDIQVKSVFASVDEYFNYSGTTDVEKIFDLNQSDVGNYWGIILAPTDDSGESLVEMKIYDNNRNLLSRISGIPVVISRNNITVLRQRYLQEKDKWELSLFVDGNWEVIHTLVIG